MISRWACDSGRALQHVRIDPKIEEALRLQRRAFRIGAILAPVLLLIATVVAFALQRYAFR
jgi:hypothetical protein